MSVQLKTLTTESVEGQYLYDFPKALKSVNRVSIGDRSLPFGITRENGYKQIVLLEPVDVSGVEITVMGR